MKSLKPITRAEADKHFTDLRNMPIKLCESQTGCAQHAEYYVNMHGCLICCLCHDHLDRLVRDVRMAITTGGALCAQCSAIFNNQFEFVKWRYV